MILSFPKSPKHPGKCISCTHSIENAYMGMTALTCSKKAKIDGEGLLPRPDQYSCDDYKYGYDENLKLMI
jgi:hypothetical protein